MKAKSSLYTVVVLSMLLSLSACGQSAAPAAAPTPITPTDYSLAAHWLNLPTETNKPVDVFFLYPTSFTKAAGAASNFAEIDDPGMVKGAKSSYGRIATAFVPLANVYAPYYRQADATFTLSQSFANQQTVIGGIPATDALAAFDFYIKNYNQGRPFILAGHSQGSNVLLFLLSDYMKAHPEVYARMIAAYVVGYSVMPEWLAANPHLKFAAGADDTGVIISYNTEAPVLGGTNPVVQPGARVINPITWTLTEELATAQQNLGSIQLNPDETVALDTSGNPVVIKDLADAKIDLAKGVIICSTCDVTHYSPPNAPSLQGVFHGFDYPFYYFNIRQNAAARIQAFLSK